MRTLYRRSASAPAYARLRPLPEGLAFESSYDAGLVAKFKELIPQESRRWDNAHKRWLVDPRYAKACAELAEAYLGVTLTIPTIAKPTTSTQIFKLEYLGRCKARGNGESTAFGWADDGWSVVFPEAVLRNWFEAVPQRPDEMPTFYAVLAVKIGAMFEDIRANYRRLVKQWHPDVCHEPNAAETFKAIQHAYEVLQDDAKRKKYDAGLAFQANIRRQSRHQPVIDANGYRSPLRCGWVLAEGTPTLGRFVTSKIIEWQDITNAAGETMVVSWPLGADKFEVMWR